MTIQQIAREAFVGATGVVNFTPRDEVGIDAVAVAVLREVIANQGPDGRTLLNMLDDLTPEPPTVTACQNPSCLRLREQHDVLLAREVQRRVPDTEPPTCATCQHYQPEDSLKGYCADGRHENLMRHRVSRRDWVCPMWEGQP